MPHNAADYPSNATVTHPRICVHLYDLAILFPFVCMILAYAERCKCCAQQIGKRPIAWKQA